MQNSLVLKYTNTEPLGPKYNLGGGGAGYSYRLLLLIAEILHQPKCISVINSISPASQNSWPTHPQIPVNVASFTFFDKNAASWWLGPIWKILISQIVSFP